MKEEWESTPFIATTYDFNSTFILHMPQITFSNTPDFLPRYTAQLLLNELLIPPLLNAYTVCTHSLNFCPALIARTHEKYVFHFPDREDVFLALLFSLITLTLFFIIRIEVFMISNSIKMNPLPCSSSSFVF